MFWQCLLLLFPESEADCISLFEAFVVCATNDRLIQISAEHSLISPMMCFLCKETKQNTCSHTHFNFCHYLILLLSSKLFDLVLYIRYKSVCRSYCEKLTKLWFFVCSVFTFICPIKLPLGARLHYLGKWCILWISVIEIKHCIKPHHKLLQVTFPDISHT